MGGGEAAVPWQPHPPAPLPASRALSLLAPASQAMRHTPSPPPQAAGSSRPAICGGPAPEGSPEPVSCGCPQRQWTSGGGDQRVTHGAVELQRDKSSLSGNSRPASQPGREGGAEARERVGHAAGAASGGRGLRGAGACRGGACAGRSLREGVARRWVGVASAWGENLPGVPRAPAGTGCHTHSPAPRLLSAEAAPPRSPPSKSLCRQLV